VTADVPRTVEQARRELVRLFHDAGFESPELDARLLLGHALGLDHAGLISQAGRALGAGDAAATAHLARRRLAHEPVARILGRKEFWGLSFRLNAETLVPRPETETVVEAAVEALDRGGGRTHALRLADLGTGSGALLLALLSELQSAHGVGTDLSLAALRCARENAAALGLSARASFVACDYAAALQPPFDLVVANPPYIARADIAGLAPEVAAFDPLRALEGGTDGLDAYRAIAADTRRFLAPDGMLIVELGRGQRDAVAALFDRAGLAIGPSRPDLSGVPRTLMVKPVP
jgi:release factor glutamine methyltransferase